MPSIVYRDGGLDPALLWNPFSMFDQLERAVFGSADWFEWPHFDIEDRDDDTILSADMPGMSEEDVEVEVSGSMLIVRGQRRPTGRMQRRPYGSFERRFRLADGYDLDAITADLSDGVLSIQLPKTAKAKPRRIKLASPSSRGVVDKVKGLLAGDKQKEKTSRSES